MKHLLCLLGCVSTLPILDQLNSLAVEHPAKDLTVQLNMTCTNYFYPADLAVTVVLQNRHTNTVDCFGDRWTETFPFHFRIWKDDGRLLNPRSARFGSGPGQLPDESLVLAKRRILIQGGERREYKFSVRDFMDQNETRNLIPVGTYSLQATLAVWIPSETGRLQYRQEVRSNKVKFQVLPAQQ